MKKIICILCMSIIGLGVSAQSTSLTAGAGVWNTKIRVQVEHGFQDMMSAGANLSYYTQAWKGPRLEGFYRIYFGDDNEKGMFAQAKAGAGIFSYVSDEMTFVYLDGSIRDVYNSNSWMTVGGGIAMGGKITTRGGFVFESTLGYQFWSPPVENYTQEYDEYKEFLQGLETLGYYVVGPGFPLDMQIKFGYRF